jgi:hypothetical protein
MKSLLQALVEKDMPWEIFPVRMYWCYKITGIL